MRKSLAVLAVVVMAAAAVSACNNSNSSNSKMPADQRKKSVRVENRQPAQQITYSNDKFNYSLVLPAGFAPQNNDSDMEQSRGGKLFLADGAMIDCTARQMDYTYIKADESIKQGYEFALAAYAEGTDSEVISHRLQSDNYLVKAKDEYGLRADCEFQRNGISLIIHVTYPADKRADFDRDVDAMLASLKF